MVLLGVPAPTVPLEVTALPLLLELPVLVLSVPLRAVPALTVSLEVTTLPVLHRLSALFVLLLMPVLPVPQEEAPGRCHSRCSCRFGCHL